METNIRLRKTKVGLAAALLTLPVVLAMVAMPAQAQISVDATVAEHFGAAGVGTRHLIGETSQEVFVMDPEVVDANTVVDTEVLDSANGYITKVVTVGRNVVDPVDLQGELGSGLVEQIGARDRVDTRYLAHNNPNSELEGIAAIEAGVWYDGRIVSPRYSMPRVDRGAEGFSNWIAVEQSILDYCGVEMHFINALAVAGAGPGSVDDALATVFKIPLAVVLNPHNSDVCTTYLGASPLSLSYTTDEGETVPFKMIRTPAEGIPHLSETEKASLGDSLLSQLSSDPSADGGRLGPLLLQVNTGLFNPYFALHFGADCSAKTAEAAADTARFLGMELLAPLVANCLRVISVVASHGDNLAGPVPFLDVSWSVARGTSFGATETYVEVQRMYDACNNEAGEIGAPVSCLESFLDCHDTVVGEVTTTRCGVLVARNTISISWQSAFGDIDADGDVDERDKKAILSLAVGETRYTSDLHAKLSRGDHFFGVCGWIRYNTALALEALGLREGISIAAETPLSTSTGAVLENGFAFATTLDVALINHYIAFPEKIWYYVMGVGLDEIFVGITPEDRRGESLPGAGTAFVNYAGDLLGHDDIGYAASLCGGILDFFVPGAILGPNVYDFVAPLS